MAVVDGWMAVVACVAVVDGGMAVVVGRMVVVACVAVVGTMWLLLLVGWSSLLVWLLLTVA